jgi:hypothetical protein
MRTGIIGDTHADRPDARVFLHALEGYCGGRKLRQVKFAIDANKSIIGG